MTMDMIFFSLSLSIYMCFFHYYSYLHDTDDRQLTSLQDVVMLASASQSPQAAWETLFERLRVATSGQ